MSTLEVFLGIISVVGTISAILFGYLAFARGKRQDIQNDERVNSQQQLTSAVDIATIKIDLKYTRDGIDRIGTRLDAIEKTQSRVGENIAKINEHLLRTDARLDKVEKRLDELEKYHMKGEDE